MARYALTVCLGLVLLLSLSRELRAEVLPKWPVRNGDFSRAYQAWGDPDWILVVDSGKHEVKIEPAHARMVNPPSAAVIETIEGGTCHLYQTLSLMKGDYRLTVEFSGHEGARAQVCFGETNSEPLEVSEEWKVIQLDNSVPAGETTISLMAISAAGQAVKFRNVKVEVKSLSSSPVPLADGTQLGGLVLPEKPGVAEQYAGYELQQYIFKITGRVPGIQGRDKVYDGKMIYLGRAASERRRAQFEGLPDDAYLTHARGNTISLAGKTDQGTLYAVYDFLREQGCRWVIPGDLGEVVPRREALVAPRSKIESPDYDCRGIMVMAQDFFPGGGAEMGWAYINPDDYFDWCLRNRLNGLWFAEQESYDFGAHRGHGWIQILGHTYGGVIAPHAKYFEDHPDWYALVQGKRTPVCDLGPKFVNQLCVSNPGLRDYTVDRVLDYFRNNPRAKAFALSPMDPPSYWCECEACEKLDPPGVDWSTNASEGWVSGMADRCLNYVNEIAERVSEVYPDKLIEMYAYGCTLTAPVREKVHRNVFMKYANLSGGRGTGPLGRSMLDNDVAIWTEWRNQLDGWREAGATMALYNYLEWEHPDVTLFWFYNTVDVLRTFNRQYNCKMLLGETENNVLISTMLYNVLAQTTWDVDTDYKQVIRDVCDAFYGPVADDLYAYNMTMDNAIRASNAWQEEDWRPNEHQDIPLEVLEQGQEILEQVAEKITGDETLSRRTAYARFGHAYLTYIRALHEKKKTPRTVDIARQAFDFANALRLEHRIMVKLPSAHQLETFYYPPVIEESRSVIELPEMWDFKKDPADVGMTEKWSENDIDDSWVKISTSQDWTSQDPGRGYHGVAWYHVRFALPSNVKAGDGLMLYFGAVDGIADVFLDRIKIGEQKMADGVMWDKPFTIPLPANLDPAGAHHLLVRVKKDTFAAGIWKPVRIMAVAQEER